MSDTQKRQRRQRAVLSCKDCHRRKLKCDRELPCNRCINGNIAAQCAYGPEPLTGPPEQSVKRQRQASIPKANVRFEEHSPAPVKVGESLFRSDIVQSDISAQNRIDQLEREVALLRQQSVIHVDKSHEQIFDFVRPSGENEVDPPVYQVGMLKGRNYATFYYGPSSAISIIAHFPDLRSFMKCIYQNSTAQRLAQDMKVLEGRSQSINSSYSILSIPHLRSLLPDRGTVDILIRQYLDTFETTYRILHLPSFEAAYRLYWDSEKSTGTDMDALVLAVLACTICTSTHDSPRYNHSGSNFHSKAVSWIKACEAWLRRHSNKHRTLASLQVRCLRLLALSASSHKVKEYYQETQAHMAFMRSSGLHRDPSIIGTRCSVFEGEMRRRLWATSMELELQASIDKGTPSVLSSLEYDCTSPHNLNDTDIYVGMEELPQSLPISTFTDTSFLHSSMQTTDLRTRLCALTNSLKSSMSFQDTLRYTDTVQRSLQAIPEWANLRSKQAQTLLDLQLRQFLVILFTSKALRFNTNSGAESWVSIIGSLEASVKVIDMHTHILNMPNLALCCTRNDYFRAAMLICHIAYHASKSDDKIIAQVAKASFDHCVHKALRLQEERAMRPGRGGQQHWYLSAVVALVGLQYDPSQHETMKNQAIGRVSRLLYKMLSLQEDPSEQALASEVLLEDTSATPTHADATLNTAAEPPSAEVYANAELRLDAFDIGGVSEWMLDDFWFFNDGPALDFNGQSRSDL